MPSRLRRDVASSPLMRPNRTVRSRPQPRPYSFSVMRSVRYMIGAAYAPSAVVSRLVSLELRQASIDAQLDTCYV